MKNKAGIIIGFSLGFIGFLFMFKLVFLDNIPPADEIAPGMVVIAAVLNGSLFAIAGHLAQNYFRKTKG